MMPGAHVGEVLKASVDLGADAGLGAKREQLLRLLALVGVIVRMRRIAGGARRTRWVVITGRRHSLAGPVAAPTAHPVPVAAEMRQRMRVAVGVRADPMRLAEGNEVAQRPTAVDDEEAGGGE